MAKEDKSEVYRELYVQYSDLESPKQIFEKIIAKTNGEVSLRSLYNYKKEWDKHGLQKELKAKARERKKEKQDHTPADKLGKKERAKERDVIKGAVKQVVTYAYGSNPPTYDKEKPNVEGMSITDVVTKVLNEYVNAEHTLEVILQAHGMDMRQFETAVSQDAKLIGLFEGAFRQQRKNAANGFIDNMVMWMKRSCTGQSEVRTTTEYEIRPLTGGGYDEIPVKKYVTQTNKLPPPSLLADIMKIFKEALLIDKNESKNFYEFADGYNMDEVRSKRQFLIELKEKRLDERRQLNTP